MKKYIVMFVRMDAPDTMAVMLIKLVCAMVFSMETLLVARLVNSMISSISGKNAGGMFLYVALVVGFWSLERALVYTENVYSARLKKAAQTYLNKHLIEKKEAIPYEVFERAETQELLKRVSDDTAEKFGGYFDNAVYLVGNALKLTGLLGILSCQNIAAAGGLLFLLLLYLFLAVKSGKESYEAFEESEERFRRADYYKNVINDRTNVAEWSLFQAGEFFCEKWRTQFQEAVQIECRALWKLLARTEMGNVLTSVFVGLVTAVLVWTAVAGSVSAGFLIAFLKSMVGYIDSVSGELSKRVSSFVEGMRFIKDYETFEAFPGKEREAETEIVTVQSIEFRNVSFSYPGSDKKVLDDISFTLERRYHYALVGENGSGKSTILKLLMGFYDTYTGAILVNGRDIRDISKESLRRIFSYVPQEITGYEVRLEEYLDGQEENRKREIFKKLGLVLPAMDSNPLLGRIEEDGIELSGGQWQLLAIARALLERREIYILDEPTAAIDPVREAYVYGIFHDMMKQKCACMITHRLGAARIADKIMVLKDGKVWEMGNHEQLMEKRGVYYTMFETQKRWYTVSRESA